jgi:hypothetical protein
MTEITSPEDRDSKTGRFLPGNSGFGGRPKGSRNRHSEVFLSAFAADFEQHGAAVIERVRQEQPSVYLRVAADLLPREATLDVDVSVVHEVGGVLNAFRVMSDLLGTDPELARRRLRRLAPRIEDDDVSPGR